MPKAGENPSLTLASDACTVSHIETRRMGSWLGVKGDREDVKMAERRMAGRGVMNLVNGDNERDLEVFGNRKFLQASRDLSAIRNVLIHVHTRPCRDRSLLLRRAHAQLQ
jgi:hypothetical protein